MYFKEYKVSKCGKWENVFGLFIRGLFSKIMKFLIFKFFDIVNILNYWY